MPRIKILDKEIEKAITDLLYKEDRYMSTKEITERLKKEYNIKRSPQVILRHVENLKKDGKIKEKENGKKKV